MEASHPTCLIFTKRFGRICCANKAMNLEPIIFFTLVTLVLRSWDLKCNVLIVHLNDAIVAYANLMGITPQILQYLFRPTKGSFVIGYPVFMVKHIFDSVVIASKF